jgi:hypothetical protein
MMRVAMIELPFPVKIINDMIILCKKDAGTE